MRVLRTPRLWLRPLAVGDAPSMVAVLADDDLYAFTGGSAPSLTELTRRYERQTTGPTGPEGADERWLNWIVGLDGSPDPVGFVQATVRATSAEVAWLVGLAHQGRGLAQESVTAMLDELANDGIERVTAHIHPDHQASQKVAAAVGMVPGDEMVDGEVVWVLDLPSLRR